MAYSDILNAVNMYGNVLGKKEEDFLEDKRGIYEGGVSPYTSEGYVQDTYRDVASSFPEVVHAQSQFSDYKPSVLTQFPQAAMGLQLGQGLKEMAPDILGKGAANLGNLSLPLALYGATQNQNPYDYTTTEKLGTIGSTVLGARALAPAIFPGATAAGMTAAGTAPILGMHPAVLIGGLLLGGLFSSKKKKKAARMRREATAEYNKALKKQSEQKEKRFLTQREEFLGEQQGNWWEQQASKYANQYGGYTNPYSYYGDEGMKFSPKELKKIKKAGRFGDTELVHVNPEEKALLRALGGSGTINPYTGLEENWRFLRKLMGGISRGAKAVSKPIYKAADPIVRNLVDPVTRQVVTPGLRAAVRTVARPLRLAENLAGNLTTGVTRGVKGGLSALSKLNDPIFDIAAPIMNPIFDVAEGVVKPVAQTVGKGLGALAGATTDIFGNIIDTGFDATKGLMGGITNIAQNVTDPLFDLLGGSGYEGINRQPGAVPISQRDPVTPDKPISTLPVSEGPTLANISQRNVPGSDFSLGMENQWRWDLDNPYIEENVDVFERGGVNSNAVAELTGNELIVNDQDNVERALAKNDYKYVANSIKNALKAGHITPGRPAHSTNPLNVTEDGIIYDEGGTLPFRINKGAGVYDHASSQFKNNMSDKEIAMVVKKNISKWKSNNMY